MNNMMLVREINIEKIIKEKIRFIKESEKLEGAEEYIYVNQGELSAYYEMIEDISILSVGDFVEKYRKIIIKMHNMIERKKSLSEKDVEQMVGYNNAIVEVLRLINPIHEFEC